MKLMRQWMFLTLIGNYVRFLQVSKHNVTSGSNTSNTYYYWWLLTIDLDLKVVTFTFLNYKFCRTKVFEMWMLRLTEFAVYSNAMLLQVLWHRVFTCYFNQISPPFLYLTTILTKFQRKFNKVPTFFTPKCDRTNFCKCWLEFNQVYYIEHWFWYRLLYCHKYDKNLQKYNFKMYFNEQNDTYENSTCHSGEQW